MKMEMEMVERISGSIASAFIPSNEKLTFSNSRLGYQNYRSLSSSKRGAFKRRTRQHPVKGSTN